MISIVISCTQQLPTWAESFDVKIACDGVLFGEQSVSLNLIPDAMSPQHLGRDALPSSDLGHWSGWNQ